MTKETKQLVANIRRAGEEDAAKYIENLTDKEKEKIRFVQTTEDLLCAFQWYRTPQGEEFWVDLNDKIYDFKIRHSEVPISEESFDFVDRYLRIVKWLKTRYTKDGMLTMIRNGHETKYAVLEREFFKKYITKTR